MEQMSLYELRTSLGLSIKAFAKTVGYSDGGIKDAEIGKNHVSDKLKSIVKLIYNVELIDKPRIEKLNWHDTNKNNITRENIISKLIDEYLNLHKEDLLQYVTKKLKEMGDER